jgi:PTH1 family peptidyl-tRNA hydrolase
MYLIIGLGNPEADYANTRHNMGFNVINKLSEKYDIEVKKEKFKALFGTGVIDGEKVILIKPQTFMNLSGEAVQEFVNFYKVPLENMLVIYDDVDIEPGKIRIRKNGSSGHHNGMKSIIKCLNSENFPRIRVGIGKPQGSIDMIAHVIGGISEEDKKPLEEGVNLGAEAVIEILKNNIDTAMNKYN